MAGAGYKDFTAGDVLTAAQVDTYLMEQSVMVFASTSARDTALSAAKAEGMFAFNSDDDRLYYYTGSAWSPVLSKVSAYTPTMTNVTVGNGTASGWYCYMSGCVRFSASFVFGSTSSISNAPKFSLPATTSNTPFDSDISGHFIDGGVVLPAIHDNPTTTTTGFLYSFATSGSFVASGSVDATTPFTWTTGDAIQASGIYRL